MKNTLPFTFCALFAFIVISVLLYHPGFSGPMMYDSEHLTRNAHAFAAHDLGQVIGIFPQRPFSMASFYLNYLFFGLDPYFFRVGNALLLGLAATALMILAWLMLEMRFRNESREGAHVRLVAAGLALLFLTHPVQAYVVLHVYQRQALMAILFYLAALAVYIATRGGRLRSLWIGYSATALLYLCAMLSKEIAISLPVILVVAEFSLFKRDVRRRPEGLFLAGLLLVIGLVPVAMLERPYGQEGSGIGLIATLRAYYAESGLSPWQVALSQCRVIFSYLGMLLVPTPNRVVLFHPEELSRSLLDPPVTLAAAIGLVASIGAIFWLARRRPVICVGVALFFVSLLPESICVPQYLFFGYRAVLPSAGVLLVLGDLSLSFINRQNNRFGARTRTTLVFAVVAVLLVGLALVSVQKAALWRDCETFWQDAVDRLPPPSPLRESRPYVHTLTNLGLCLEGKGRRAEALQVYQRASEIDPGSVRVLVSIGKNLAAVRQLSEAEEYFRRALALDPRTPLDRFFVHFGYASLLDEQQRFDEALRHYEEALRTGKHPEAIYNNVGLIMMRRGMPNRAAKFFEKALAIRPDLPQPHASLAEIFFVQGRFEEALAHCRESKLHGGECQVELLELLIKERSGR
ncbi:MAG: tetratricopeptide repeat protein [Thermodesulfobacteriota bacterium]